MIIAIEGAPGVGKSTTAASLLKGDAYVIPEVNQLFARPDPQPREWYFERQVARWEMARFASRQRLAVLDGDLYQPLWFAWIYKTEGWPQNDWAFDFFRRRIAQGHMGFPDLYFLACIPEAVRRNRMFAREMAYGSSVDVARAKTERYARMVEPQRRFFEALATAFPGWVVEFEANVVEDSGASIRQALRTRPTVDPLQALDFIEHWLATNPVSASKGS
jgi:hypothetical protein